MEKTLLWIFGVKCLLLAALVPIGMAYVGETVSWLAPRQVDGQTQTNALLAASGGILTATLIVGGIAALLKSARLG